MLARVKDAFRDPEFTKGFMIVFAINALLIFLFHDKGWIPNDDGHYAHVANRVAKGQVLSRDIEELHPGYVHFIHAWSLKLFGTSLVSLRYPLMLLMGLQSLGVYALFRRAGLVTAVTAALVMSSIGALEIVNPTTSLYAEACAVAAAALLVTSSPSSRRRYLKLGVLLGLVFLFRQLSAIFVVIGAFAFVLTERQPESTDDQEAEGGHLAAQALIAFMFIGLAFYLYTSSTKLGWVLFGLVPLMFLAWAMCSVTVTNRRFFPMMMQIAAGSLLSAVPLVVYHVYHGSLVSWLRDTFLRSISINSLDTKSANSFWSNYIVPAIVNLFARGPIFKLNAIYWLVLLSAAVALGIALMRRVAALRKAVGDGGRFEGLSPAYALPVIAVFYAQVSVFSEVPYYLYLGVGFTLIGGLWMWKLLPLPVRPAAIDAAPRRVTMRRASVGIAWFAILIAIGFHAGQPFSRNHSATVSGVRMDMVDSQVPNLGLWIPEESEERYLELIEAIDARTEPGDQLMTVPNLAEVYFFSGLDNDFRIFNPTISLLNEDEVADFVEEFEQSTPKLLVHDTTSQYNSGETPGLLTMLLENYELVETIERFDIYERTT